MVYGHSAEIACPVGLAPQGGNDLLHHVVNVADVHLHGRVIDLNGQTVCRVVAEGGDGGIVVGSAPFAEKVGEAVHQHVGAGFLAVGEEQVFPGLLAFAVSTSGVAAREAGLHRGGQQHRAGVFVLFQGVQKAGGEAEVALHKLLGVLRPVDTG